MYEKQKSCWLIVPKRVHTHTQVLFSVSAVVGVASARNSSWFSVTIHDSRNGEVSEHSCWGTWSVWLFCFHFSGRHFFQLISMELRLVSVREDAQTSKSGQSVNISMETWTAQTGGMLLFAKYFFSYGKDVSVLCHRPLNLEKRIDESLYFQKFEFDPVVFKSTLYIWLLPTILTLACNLKPIHGCHMGVFFCVISGLLV